MVEVQLQIAEEALSALRETPDRFVQEMRIAAAIHWYQQSRISQEKAALIAGMDRTDFLAELARRHVDVFVVDMDDLRRELADG